MIQIFCTPLFERAIGTQESKRALLLAPHQTSKLIPREQASVPAFSARTSSVPCYCQESPNSSATSGPISELLESAGRSGGPAVVWIDPTGLPLRCLARAIAEFSAMTPPDMSIGLALRSYAPAHSGKTAISVGEAATPWTAQSGGGLTDNPIWYPDLGAPTSDLARIADDIRPMDIFPLVHFPSDVLPEPMTDWVRHKLLLEDFHVRSERFIFYEDRWPEQVFFNLRNSFEAHSRSTGATRTVAVTLRDSGPAFLSIVMACVFSGGYFAMPPDVVPFTGKTQLSGSAILRIRG